jgi:hypothetical protein
LKNGVYLVFQPETAVGYLRIRPFFVSVPVIRDGVPVYDILACPKTEKEEESEIPDTGDSLLFYAGLLPLSGILMLRLRKRLPEGRNKV